MVREHRGTDSMGAWLLGTRALRSTSRPREHSPSLLPLGPGQKGIQIWPPGLPVCRPGPEPSNHGVTQHSTACVCVCVCGWNSPGWSSWHQVSWRAAMAGPGERGPSLTAHMSSQCSCNRPQRRTPRHWGTKVCPRFAASCCAT